MDGYRCMYVQSACLCVYTYEERPSFDYGTVHKLYCKFVSLPREGIKDTRKFIDPIARSLDVCSCGA